MKLLCGITIYWKPLAIRPWLNSIQITKDIPATVLAKIETTNPGNSIKDRMALKMIEDAEKNGLLKPGGTIIEGTSGNTGMGLAIAAVIKGYKCIFTSTDKQSKEKFDALRAFGAEVIVCPTNVDPEDPALIILYHHVWSVKCPIPGNPTSMITCPIRRRTTNRPRPKYGSKPKVK